MCLSVSNRRALLYYRILSKSPRDAADVIGSKRVVSGAFLEDRLDATQVGLRCPCCLCCVEACAHAVFVCCQEQVFREFDTLSVCYELPESEFVDATHRMGKAPAAAAATVAPVAAPAGVHAAAPPRPPAASPAPAASLLDDPFDAFSGPPAPAPAPRSAAPAPAYSSEVDLLGLDGFGFAAPAPAPAPAAPAFALTPSPQLDPAGFQAKWGSLPVG